MSKNDEQHWKPIVLEWSESNLSPSAYCKAKGIPSSSFSYWKKKFSPILSKKIGELKSHHKFFEVQQRAESQGLQV